MAIIDIFSKRQRRARGEVPDVYTYDNLPRPLKVQIIHIIGEAIDVEMPYPCAGREGTCRKINQVLCREYGLFRLDASSGPEAQLFNFFLAAESIDRSLDVVELCFQEISSRIETNTHSEFSRVLPEAITGAIPELNTRFREHGVGFQFESGQLIRVDSRFLHSEAVKPALGLLHDQKFKGPNEEFLNAHDHYRHGRNKESLAEALKAFESTMKVIIKLRGWPTNPKDTAKDLIGTCIKNGLFPPALQSQLGTLRSLLESGVPTASNNFGRHGQGAIPTSVPDYFARYALNLTATTVLFLVEAHLSLLAK